MSTRALRPRFSAQPELRVAHLLICLSFRSVSRSRISISLRVLDFQRTIGKADSLKSELSSPKFHRRRLPAPKCRRVACTEVQTVACTEVQTVACTEVQTVPPRPPKRWTVDQSYVANPEGPPLYSLKGGDPAAGSPTATLLRLHPSRSSDLGRLPPEGWLNGFWSNQLPWCDGRCVQGPGTYSPRHADPRLLAIPTSWSRVADSNPD